MKAIIVGATGLVGNLILKYVLEDPQFSEVRVFVRKTSGIKNPKLKEFISPMTDINELRADIKGDILFNALGTTIKQAGSKKEQQRVDRDLPVSFAKIASENGVGIMLNVSSVGADVNSGFYLKTKAEMESGTGKYFPGNVFHFRPGLLVGDRNKFRLAEKIATILVKIIDPLLIGKSKKYRSMLVDNLAQAMVRLSINPEGKATVLYYPEIMDCLKLQTP
jgi:uncharacterized protein YbjT (DUF2867 family)